MKPQFEIGIIGAGNAAEGIVHGIFRKTLLFDDRMIAADPNPERRRVFADRFNIAVTDDNRELVENSRILLLAIKPQDYQDVGKQIADLLREEHLIVSIMAGVRSASLEALFPHVSARVIRAMPNLPCHVGAGMAGLFKGQHAHEADLLRARRIFDAGGLTLIIEDENQMDAVTAISGTGPAYYYFFTEAVIVAARAAGLSPYQSNILAKQSCLGAARMMLESGDSPDLLRERVTSKGGTTQAAVSSMNESKVFDHIVEAVSAAWRRSQELGR